MAMIKYPYEGLTMEDASLVRTPQDGRYREIVRLSTDETIEFLQKNNMLL